MSDQLETKSFGLRLTKAPTDDGTFEGYAAVFGNEDFDCDIIEPGAFAKTLSENPQVPILWQHDTYEPIGVSSEMVEDEKGLKVIGQLELEVQRAREARALMRAGALKGLSIGYKTVRYEIEKADNWLGFIRHLVELKLKEWSPVTFAANPLAQISGVKAAAALGEHEQRILALAAAGDIPKAMIAASMVHAKEGRELSDTDRPLVEQAVSTLQALLNPAAPASATQPAKGAADLTVAPEVISTLRSLQTGMRSRAA